MAEMMQMWILAFIASATASADPLAPALAGQAQCYSPDVQKKTCQSLAFYKRLTDGSYSNTAIVLISASGPITLETKTPVTVKNGAVCGTISAEDITAGQLRAAGNLIPSDKAAPALAQIATAMAKVIGKEICTTYTTDGQDLEAEISIDGVPQAEPAPRVRWVKPEDGYVVAN